MIYKNNVTITTLYLNGNQISKGYKGEVQFFGQTQPVSSSTTITIQEIAEQEQWATGVNLENTATYGGFTFDFTGGARYYTNGGVGHLRVYNGNQLTISGSQIYAIKFTTISSSYNFVDNDCSQDDIFYNEGTVQTFVFSSGESSVSFVNGDNNQIRIVQMEIFTSLDQQTTAPTISYDEQTKTVTATATGNETVILYVDGIEYSNPGSLDGQYGTHNVYAIGVEEGKLPSKSETLTITIEQSVVPTVTDTITVANIANQQGWQTGDSVNSFIYNNFQFSGNGLTYYNTSSNPHNIRVYRDTGNMTISSNETIVSVTFTCTTQALSFISGDAPNYTFTDNGDLTQTFSDINSNQFTINNSTSSYRRWTQVEITTEAY